MFFKKEIDLRKLYDMLAEGKTGKECAEYFNVSPAAISKARGKLILKELGYYTKKNPEIVPPPKPKPPAEAKKPFDLREQIEAINAKTWDLVEHLENIKSKKDRERTMLACFAEIRSQHALMLQVLREWNNWQRLQDFIQEILLVLKEIDRDIQRKIIERLYERGIVSDLDRQDQDAIQIH